MVSCSNQKKLPEKLRWTDKNSRADAKVQITTCNSV